MCLRPATVFESAALLLLLLESDLEAIPELIYIYASMISSPKAIEEISRRRAEKNGNWKYEYDNLLHFSLT